MVGALATTATAMNYIIMVLLGAPAVAFGVAIIKRNADEMPRVVGLLIGCARRVPVCGRCLPDGHDRSRTRGADPDWRGNHRLRRPHGQGIR